MSIAQNFPNLKPTLLLDFSNTEALDSMVTFTRASTATYYGTQTAKAEENLLLQSQTFDSSSWQKTAATVAADSTAAPDGTLTADTFSASATTEAHFCAQNSSVVVGLAYTMSVFAKAGTTNFLQVFAGSVNFGANVWANFDLSAGTVGTVGSSATASIISVGNGWYRCVISNAIATSSTLSSPVAFSPINSASATRNAAFDGTGHSIFIWGAQLEQRASVTAYTPTTTAPITNYIPVLQTAAAGVARFDHNPTTFESLGLLIEEQRTNLLTYSEQFDNAAWSKGNSTITADTIVSPDGAVDASKVVENTATSIHILSQNEPTPFTSGLTYTFSLYLKAGERFRGLITLATAATAFGSVVSANFNLQDGTITAGAGSPIVGITSVGNGWFRLTITKIAVATTSEGGLGIRMANDAGATTYTGDGYSGIYVWGAQLETGGFATSYIPTVASQVTRANDAASMTGTNFSSWYNQAEGTLFSQASCQGIGSFNASIAFSVSDGTTSNVIRTGWHGGLAGTQPTSTQSGITTNGTSQAAISGGYISGFNTSAFAYKRNDLAASANGGAAGTDTDAILPNVISASIGNWTGTQPINGTIKKIAYYPIRVTNAQLVALTS